MPLYNVACQPALSAQKRASVAEAMKEAHCRVTGAPPQLVIVVYLDGHPLPRGTALSLVGGIRSGGTRDAGVVEELRTALREGMASAAGVSTDAVDITLVGVPWNWVIEDGVVIPEPGKEAEWMEQQKGAGATAV